jgi:hypothetical protein
MARRTADVSGYARHLSVTQRTLAQHEKKTGFGWVQAKPARSMAPYAITPDELGEHWRNGRVCLDLEVLWNDRRFGNANGEPMEFGFHEVAPRVGIEPTTNGLTVRRSTAELPRNRWQDAIARGAILQEAAPHVKGSSV